MATYVVQTRPDPTAPWRDLSSWPNRRFADEAAAEELGRMPSVHDLGFDSNEWVRILLEVHSIDVGSREEIMGHLAYDPLLRTFFDFGASQGGSALVEVAGGPSAALSQRVAATTPTVGPERGNAEAADRQVNGAPAAARRELAHKGARIQALHDVTPLIPLLLQSLITNAEEQHGALSEEAKDAIQADVISQLRFLFESLDVTPEELDAADIKA